MSFLRDKGRRIGVGSSWALAGLGYGGTFLGVSRTINMKRHWANSQRNGIFGWLVVRCGAALTSRDARNNEGLPFHRI
jgi:hypothetical protein